MSRILLGTRVYPQADGTLPDAIYQPGAYGQEASASPQTHWYVTCPDGTTWPVNSKTHRVLAHDDGTITIQPAIDLRSLPWEGWRGWLNRGVWTARA